MLFLCHSGFHMLKNKFNSLVKNIKWFSNDVNLEGQFGSTNGPEPNSIFESTKYHLSYKNMVIATQTTNHIVEYQIWAFKINKTMS